MIYDKQCIWFASQARHAIQKPSVTWAVSQLESCEVRETTRLVGWRECKPGADCSRWKKLKASQGMTWNNCQNRFGNLWGWTFLWTFIHFIFCMSFMLMYLHFSKNQPAWWNIGQVLGARVHVSSKCVLILLLFTCITSTVYYQTSRNWSQRRLEKTKNYGFNIYPILAELRS